MSISYPYLFRPAQAEDLDDLERFARASTYGINSLPPRRERLVERLERSQRSFDSTDNPTGEESFLFVVEDRSSKRVIGTSGITSIAGAQGRFYSYRNEFALHTSEELGITNRTHTLRLCQDLSGHSLLTSFYVEPEYATTLAPQLLSRARLLFIRQFSAWFADRIAAENPGLCDEMGRSPLWEALGRRFFKMDFPQAELLVEGRSKSYIGELMPSSSIYVPLLAEEAQWALGQLHADAELPFSILIDEGFDADSYVDIFDGGPTVEARTAMLATVVSADSSTLQISDERTFDQPLLLANQSRTGFRALIASCAIDARTLVVAKADADQLGLIAGNPVTHSTGQWLHSNSDT